MRIFWKKVTSDLLLHPARSALLAVALVLGSASLAAGLFAQAVMDREIRASFARALPPDVVIVLERVSADTIRAVAEDPAVLAAEPRRKLRGRIETADGTFVSLLVTVMPSLTDQEVSAIRLEENVAETKGDGVLIERSSVAVLGFSPGSMLTMRLPGGIETAARFAGIAADGAVAPGIQDRIVYAYATPGQAAALGVGEAYSELHVRLADNVPLGAAIESLTDRLAAQGIVPQRLERSAVRHPHADQMQTRLDAAVGLRSGRACHCSQSHCKRRRRVPAGGPAGDRHYEGYRSGNAAPRWRDRHRDRPGGLAFSRARASAWLARYTRLRPLRAWRTQPRRGFLQSECGHGGCGCRHRPWPSLADCRDHRLARCSQAGS